MRAICLSAMLLVACRTEKSGDTADALSCTEDVTQLSVEQESPLGFSARTINTVTSGDHYATLTWTNAETTGLRVRVTYADGDIRYIDRAVSGGGAEALDTAGAEELCPDTLEIDVTLSFETDDGAFDEKWDTHLVATQADSATLDYTFDPLDLNGAYDVSGDLTSADYDTLDGFAQGTFDITGSTGTLSGQASGEDDCDGDECSAWAENFDIGSWVPAD